MKTELVMRPLSEREVLPYLIVFAAASSFSSLTGFIPQTIKNRWDALETVCGFLLAVFGTIYIYRQNGGANGQHLLQRYLAIGWVVGIRCVVAYFLVAIVFYGLVVRAEAKITNWYDFLFLAVFEVILYWRIGCHVRDLAMRTMPDQFRVGHAFDSTTS